MSCSVLSVLVDQSLATVGSTVWDAEVILAYYLNALPSLLIGTKCDTLRFFVKLLMDHYFIIVNELFNFNFSTYFACIF